MGGTVESFGAYLKRARRHKAISQRDLASKIGVSPTYLSKIENGRFPAPSAETITKIAIALSDCEYDFLCAARICVHCKGTGKAPYDPSR